MTDNVLLQFSNLWRAIQAIWFHLKDTRDIFLNKKKLHNLACSKTSFRCIFIQLTYYGDIRFTTPSLYTLCKFCVSECTVQQVFHFLILCSGMNSINLTIHSYSPSDISYTHYSNSIVDVNECKADSYVWTVR